MYGQCIYSYVATFVHAFTIKYTIDYLNDIQCTYYTTVYIQYVSYEKVIVLINKMWNICGSVSVKEKLV